MGKCNESFLQKNKKNLEREKKGRSEKGSQECLIFSSCYLAVFL